MKIAIIIPAYNEEKRIEPTITAYHEFFARLLATAELNFEIIIVINGTTDGTRLIVKNLMKKWPEILMIETPEGGKGNAIKLGFLNALMRPNDLIGFVDADMATRPDAYYELIKNVNGYDGIIASRYMRESRIEPPRPFLKRWGSKLIYENIVFLLFGIRYHDFQCGAKLFKRKVIQKIASHLFVKQWAFDVELLYLCKKYGFRIKEFPSVWHDQAGSKLRVFRAGTHMLATLFKLRWHHR